MDKLQEAMNRKPSAFVGVRRVSDVYAIISNDGPTSLGQFMERGFSRSAAEKALNALYKAGVIKQRACSNGSFVIHYWELR